MATLRSGVSAVVNVIVGSTSTQNPFPTSSPVLPTQEPNYAGKQLTNYSKPFWVDAMHNYPRIYSDNVFILESQYVHGVAYIPIPYVAAAVLFTAGLAFLCLILSCIKSTPSTPQKVSRPVCLYWGCLYALAAIGLALMFTGSALVIHGLEQAKIGLYTGAQSASEVVTIYNKVAYNGEILNVLARTVSDECADATITNAIVSLRGVLEGISADAQDVRETLNDANESLMVTYDAFGLMLSVAPPVLYGIAGLCTLSLLLSAVTSLVAVIFHDSDNNYRREPNRKPRCSAMSTFGCTVLLPFALCAACFAFAFTGVVLSANTVAADICIHPDSSLKAVMSPAMQRFSELFMHCEGFYEGVLRHFNEDASYRQEIDVLLGAFASQKTVMAMCKSTRLDWGYYTDKLSNTLNDFFNNTHAAVAILACDRLHGIYAKATYTGICEMSGTGALMAWSGSILCGLCLFTLAMSMIYFVNPYVIHCKSNRHNKFVRPDSYVTYAPEYSRSNSQMGHVSKSAKKPDACVSRVPSESRVLNLEPSSCSSWLGSQSFTDDVIVCGAERSPNIARKRTNWTAEHL